MLENGTVYVFDTNGIVYALNANQGALLWRYKYTTDALQSGGTTTVSNGTVYVGSNTDEVYAINANNGSLLWRVQTDSAPSWITEGNGIAFVATSYPNYPSLQTLYAFRASDGTELWHYDITNPGNDNIPIVGNGMVFVGTLDNVYALDINSGAQRWQRNAEIVNTMALNHGILYVSYQSGGLDALDAKSGTRIWNFSAPGYIVFVTGTQVYYVYGFDGALGKAYVLDADTARLLWSYQARNYNNPSGTSLGIDAVANGQVYVDDLRYVYAFSASDGTPLWVFDSGQFQSYFINVIVS
jgi:outer membrane protein assembly factor BamB